MIRSARPKADRKREFAELYQESYSLVYNHVRYRIANDAAAEDVVADAFLKAARNFDSFDPSKSRFSTWVIAIAMNCMRDRWRRERPQVALEDVPERLMSQPDTMEDFANRDLVDRLLKAIEPEEREIVLLRYRDGLRNVEIAERLGMSASTVSTKLFNARTKMREAAGPLA